MFSGAQYGSPPKAGALGFDLGGGGFGGEIQPEIQTEIQPAPEMQASGFGGFGGDQSLAAFEAPPLTAVEPPALSVQAPAEPSAATGDMFSSFDAPHPNPPHPAPGGDAFASFEPAGAARRDDDDDDERQQRRVHELRRGAEAPVTSAGTAAADDGGVFLRLWRL
jgi:hypothetical protein